MKRGVDASIEPDPFAELDLFDECAVVHDFLTVDGEVGKLGWTWWGSRSRRER